MSSVAHHYILPYTATGYLIRFPEGEITVRIAQPHPGLDASLAARGHDRWAFITAWNPASSRLSREENLERQLCLEQRLRQLGLAFVPGTAIPDGGDWPAEESLFVMGLSEDGARELGAEFGQHAVVCGQVGGVAGLIWCA